MLAEYSPEAAKFRDDAIRKGYRPEVELYSSVFTGTSVPEQLADLDERGLRRLFPDDARRAACRALLCFYCDIDDAQFGKKWLDDKWREGFVQWYEEVRPCLKYDPTLGRFAVKKPVSPENAASPSEGVGTKADGSAVGAPAFRDRSIEDKSGKTLAPAAKDASAAVQLQPPSSLLESATDSGVSHEGGVEAAPPKKGDVETAAVGGRSRPATSNTFKNLSQLDKCAAIDSLGEAKDTNAVDDLLVLLGDESPEVREAAAKALGHIGDAKAGNSLVEVMNSDADEWVRNVAARALAEMSDPRAKATPLEPIDEGTLPAADEPAEWNADVKTAILDLSKSTRIGQRVNGCWPTRMRLGNLPVAEETGEELLRRLKRIMKVTYLPKSLVGHLIRCRNVSIPDQDSEEEADIVVWRGKPITSDALVVCYRINDLILQIQDTDYDTVIYAARNDDRPAQRRDGLRYVVETASKVLKGHIARGARTREEVMEDAEREVKEGVPQYDVRWPYPSLAWYGAKDLKELAKFRTRSGIFPAWLYVGTDGYWVQFRVMKEADTGLPKLEEERFKELESRTAE